MEEKGRAAAAGVVSPLVPCCPILSLGRPRERERDRERGREREREPSGEGGGYREKLEPPPMVVPDMVAPAAGE